MYTFYQWLERLTEERRRTVAPEILKAYDLELKDRLAQLAEDIPDPHVRAQFQSILDCPIIDARGNCRHFAEYVLGALVKNGVTDRVDVERAVQYVFEKLLVPKGAAGQNRTTIFTDFDPSTPDSAEHFRAKFLSWVKFAVGNIRRGKIRRLADVDRPPGTVSIGQGRQKQGEPAGGISPDAIPARISTDAGLGELVGDIVALLKQKELAYPVPLVAMFNGLMAGERTEDQRARYGDKVARWGRQIIIRTAEEYGQASGNYALLNLLNRFQQGMPASPPQQAPKPPQEVVDPRTKDFRSIIAVIDRFNGEPVGSAQLGSYRRRWLEKASRTPGSPLNRMDDTLNQMVADQVLRTVVGSQGGVRYVPGPNYSKYQPVV